MTKRRPIAFVLEDVLGPFRGLEEAQDAVLLLGDDDALRVLIAWTHVDNEWTAPSSPAIPPPMRAGKMAALWRWMCSGWSVDIDELSRLAGVTPDVAHRKLSMLQGNRFIYPTGEMSKAARLAIQAVTAKRLGLKPKSKKNDKTETETN